MFGFWTKAQQQQQTSIPTSTEPPPASPSPLAGTSAAAADGTSSALATELSVAISADLAEARSYTPSTISGSTDKGNNRADIATPRPSTDPDIAEIQKVPRASLQVDAASVSNQNTSGQPRRTRRLSFQSFTFGQSKNKHPAEHISHAKQVKKEEAAEEAFKERKLASTREGRKIDKAAAALATIILGPVHIVTSTAASVATSSKKPIQPPKLKPAGPQTIQKVQNQLLTPREANKVIAKLRTINPEESPNPPAHKRPQLQRPHPHPHPHKVGERPIHAVCLDCTDEEASRYHFSKLATTPEVEMRNSRQDPAPSPNPSETSFAFADITTIVPVLRSMKLITLVTAPDLGFGQPPDCPGLLAGSVPSTQAFAEGLQEVTGQLMALGFASSKVVFPNHTGVYPPTDRISVLTYWWGLELCIPPPSITYLGTVKSIQNAVLNFLTAFSLINNGVKEILPFVRYIAQFLDFEWNAIKAQDHGDGVVCASTWVMPAALVPRPWDFTPTPPEKDLFSKRGDGEPPEPPRKVDPALNGPTLAFLGSKNGIFTPNAPELPPVMITPPTLPRGIGAPPNGKGRANPFPLS